MSRIKIIEVKHDCVLYLILQRCKLLQQSRPLVSLSGAVVTGDLNEHRQRTYGMCQERIDALLRRRVVVQSVPAT